MRAGNLAWLAVTVGLCGLLHAQDPAFEVASIKPNKTNEPQSVPQMQPGRVTLVNRTLRYLVQFAYSTIESQLYEFQVVGGPDWTDVDRFDVLAKMEGSLPPGPAAANLGRRMMRPLLADRFQLKVRAESRDMPIYALVMARQDGQFGPGLRRRPESDCADGAFPRGPGPPDPNGNVPLCGFFRASASAGQGTLTYRGVSIAQLARPGALIRDRIVVDRTGLIGIFDIDLKWAMEGDPNASSTDGPSVFTAVQEQLGLKLAPARGPVPVVVIEHAAKPAPD
jgi:uncharacterized protein (TIGR03435 family)